MFKKILIANRGEIALRIIRTCREIGVKTVAVYHEVDACSPHVFAADTAIKLDGDAPLAAYLNGTQIIQAARKTRAQAIHPGYGMLAENAGFAKSCAQAGLVFIGPSPRHIHRMGNKVEARKYMRQAGIPVVPGTDRVIRDRRDLKQQAGKIGFPLMLKAVGGGGGKGIRLVEREKDLLPSFDRASSEAAKAFHNARVYLEHYFPNPRHIEFQVMGDGKGRGIHLGERDCSLQRRHQKILEESPAPHLDAGKCGAIASLCAEATGRMKYAGAGTMEFLCDEDGALYFLEMNTRLQVEHPVTELRTGLDLVHMQLAVASGDGLPLSQTEVRFAGHACEVRLYAEDPENNFLPTTGTLRLHQLPQGPGVRIDGVLEDGMTISPYFDPMMAKLIVWAEDRQRCLRRLQRALSETGMGGVTSNLCFLKAVIQSKAVMQGRYHTGYAQRFLDERAAGLSRRDLQEYAVAAVLHRHHAAHEDVHKVQKGNRLSAWQIGGRLLRGGRF